MLRNVICCFWLKVFGALKLISWKYTFKRLNEEYEIAKKKQQALDNLYASGRISQSTRDSFNIEINAAIAAIEKQQKDLIDGMQGKTQELENQLKTLETLLASYEIQHVAGEIDEDIYQREISLLSTSLETTKNELITIKQVTNQLCAPAMQAAPEPVAPVIQEVAQPVIEEPTLAPTVVEAPTIEAAVEPAPIEPATVETIPVEIPVETAKAEATPVETTPIETAPIVAAPVETVATPVETAPVETPVETAPVETPIETAPVVEVAPVETPVEAAPVETRVAEVASAEAAPIAPIEPEVHEIVEPAPEIAPKEPAIVEPATEVTIINIDTPAPEAAPTIEEATAVIETSETVPAEIVEAPKEPVVEAPIDVFVVAPETAEVETTLDKVIEPAVETVIDPVIVEEVQVPAHPLEAPQVAHPETTHEQNAEEAAAETEDSSKNSE